MKLLLKILGFIIADILIMTFLVLFLSELTRAGVMGGFGVFWNGMTGVVDAIIRWILDLCGVAHQLG